MKKALTEELPYREAIRDIDSFFSQKVDQDDNLLAKECDTVETAKKIGLYLFNEALSEFAQDLKNEHQIVEMLSDIFTDIYTAESTIIRVKKIMDSDKPIASTVDIAKTFTSEMVDRILANTHSILHAIYQGPAPTDVNKKIKQFEERMRLANNVVQSKRNIAEYVFDQKKYPY